MVGDSSANIVQRDDTCLSLKLAADMKFIAMELGSRPIPSDALLWLRSGIWKRRYAPCCGESALKFQALVPCKVFGFLVTQTEYNAEWVLNFRYV